MITSTFIDTDGYLRVLGNAAITDVFSAGNTTINGSIVTSGFVNASSYGTFGGRVNTAIEFNVGANITISNTQYHVGNATVNTVITSSSIDTDKLLS